MNSLIFLLLISCLCNNNGSCLWTGNCREDGCDCDCGCDDCQNDNDNNDCERETRRNDSCGCERETRRNDGCDIPEAWQRNNNDYDMNDRRDGEWSRNNERMKRDWNDGNGYDRNRNNNDNCGCNSDMPPIRSNDYSYRN